MNVKNILKYTFFVFLGIGLLYHTYSGISLQELVEVGRRAKFQWIGLAVGAHLANHWLRALRWRLLIEAQGYSISTLHAFIAEMSGFLMNLVPPRMGEWMRCVVLKRLERVPISNSLGAVVVERFLEMSLFSILFIAGVFIKVKAGGNILLGLTGIGSRLLAYRPSTVVLVLLGIVLLGGIFVLFRYRSVFVTGLANAKDFIKEVTIAVKNTRKSNGWRLWGANIFIIIFHFMVEYLSFFAIEEINVGLKGALLVFIAMNIGMATPTPGGIGVYHVSVITTLVSLGVETKYAIVYATLTHLIQLFNALFVGGGCLLASSFYKYPSKQKA